MHPAASYIPSHDAGFLSTARRSSTGQLRPRAPGCAWSMPAPSFAPAAAGRSTRLPAGRPWRTRSANVLCASCLFGGLAHD